MFNVFLSQMMSTCDICSLSTLFQSCKVQYLSQSDIVRRDRSDRRLAGHLPIRSHPPHGLQSRGCDCEVAERTCDDIAQSQAGRLLKGSIRARDDRCSRCLTSLVVSVGLVEVFCGFFKVWSGDVEVGGGRVSQPLQGSGGPFVRVVVCAVCTFGLRSGERTLEPECCIAIGRVVGSAVFGGVAGAGATLPAFVFAMGWNPADGASNVANLLPELQPPTEAEPGHA